ncbi:Uncharacterised protein r2_g397 [Pycnogonum litorale]
MCPQIFQDIDRVMQNQSWTWQRDGETAHTAIATVNWLLENTPATIVPANWPSKSPDSNDCIWSILLSKLQQQRGHITDDIERLKEVLTEAWNAIPQMTIQAASHLSMDQTLVSMMCWKFIVFILNIIDIFVHIRLHHHIFFFFLELKMKTNFPTRAPISSNTLLYKILSGSI